MGKSQATATTKDDAQALFQSLRSAYSATPTNLKIIDLYVVFAVFTALIQVAYMAIVGSFPFNSFLSGVLSCVGTAVLAVCLRIQVNKENKEFKDLPPERAFADFVLCNLVLHLAPFDATSQDNMRRLVDHAGLVGHIYPLPILCHDIMPPPRQVEKEIGEKRLISFHGTGISVAPEIDFHIATASCGYPEEPKTAYSQALYDSVREQYNVLQSAINGAQGLEASTPNVSLSQPVQSLD